MSFISTKSEYHVALNGQGLLLQGAPERPAYKQSQAPVYGNRFAMGDRGYTDFSFWWFWAQTDFSGGIKQDTRWADDGKYHSSDGITVVENPGSVLLNWRQSATGVVPFGDVAYGHSISWYAISGQYLLGRDNTDGTALISDALTRGTVAEGTASSAAEIIQCGDSGFYGCKTVVDGASMVKTLSGANLTDVGALNVGGGVMDIIYDKANNQLWAFTYSAGIYEYDIPTTTWAQRTTVYPLAEANLANFSPYTAVGAYPNKAAVLVSGKIYFSRNSTELWSFDTGDYTFAFITEGINMKIAAERFGIIYYYRNINSIPQIWKYVISTGVISKVCDVGRHGSGDTIIKMANYDDDIYMVTNGTRRILVLDQNETLYNGFTVPAAFTAQIDVFGGDYLTIVKNDGVSTNAASIASSKLRHATGYISTSIFDAEIPSIDKLYYSLTIDFDLFNSDDPADKITVSYSLNNGSTFTTLGSASYADDGAISTKTFLFGTNITSKTLQIKFTLISGVSTDDTPSLNSFSVQYVPVPDYKKIWSLTVNAGDEVKKLNGKTVTDTGRELKSILETAWWTKSLLDYQDLDYATTLVNDASFEAADVTIIVDNTKDFPEQGRLHIDDEEILYTGKTPTTFTGCTRGARGTLAADHADDSVVNNAYKVLITEFQTDIPVMNEDKNLEYRIGISIREA